MQVRRLERHRATAQRGGGRCQAKSAARALCSTQISQPSHRCRVPLHRRSRRRACGALFGVCAGPLTLPRAILRAPQRNKGIYDRDDYYAILHRREVVKPAGESRGLGSRIALEVRGSTAVQSHFVRLYGT